MIISVPHSGTRSLRQHLCEERGWSWVAEDPNYDPNAGYWHFGQNQPDIDRFDGHADIPIRDPFDVSMSWVSRYGDEPEKNQAGLNKLFDLMIDFAWARPDTTFHVVEDLPIRKGEGPKHWAKDKRNRGRARQTQEAIELVRWITSYDKRIKFYQRFYKSFWWL